MSDVVTRVIKVGKRGPQGINVVSGTVSIGGELVLTLSSGVTISAGTINNNHLYLDNINTSTYSHVNSTVSSMLGGYTIGQSLTYSVPTLSMTNMFGTTLSNINLIGLRSFVNSIQELRDWTHGPVVSVNVNCHSTDGDGGGGPFRYVYGAAPSTYVDNNGTVIVPTGGNGSSAWLREWEGPLKCEAFGLTKDGTGDNTVALQSAFNLGIPLTLGVGVFRTTSELYFVDGTKLHCAGNYSGDATLTVYQTGLLLGTTVIRYDGVAGDDVCIIRLADSAVGVQPSNVYTRNMQNIALSNIVLDGNAKAGIGLYLVRALLNNKIEYITVTNTTKHGFLAILNWGGGGKHWVAFMNRGCGITIGKNVYGWSGGSATASTVDEGLFEGMYAFQNGHDLNRVALSQFSESTDDTVENEYGIGVFGGRSLTFINTTSANNSGAGVLINSATWPIMFNGLYVERNCQSINATRTEKLSQSFVATEGQTVFTLTEFYYRPLSGGATYITNTAEIAVYVNDVLKTITTDYTEGTPPANWSMAKYITFINGLTVGDVVKIQRTFYDPWGVWFQGSPLNDTDYSDVGVSRHVSFNDVYFGLRDQIRLTGAEPSRKGEDALVFSNVPLLNRLVADWGNYRLIDCDGNLSGTQANQIPSTKPYMIRPVINQQLNLDITGVIAFQVSGGAITSGYMVSGLISGVTYVSAGLYEITLNQTFDYAKYGIFVTAADNRLIGVVSKTTNSFRIQARSGSTPSDSTYVNVMIVGYYVP